MTVRLPLRTGYRADFRGTCVTRQVMEMVVEAW